MTQQGEPAPGLSRGSTIALVLVVSLAALAMTAMLVTFLYPWFVAFDVF